MMKQTNNLLNISNFSIYIFCIALMVIIEPIFPNYAYVSCSTIILILAILNLVIGIININKKSKKNGILNIIISILFIFDSIMFAMNDDTDEWTYPVFLVCIIVPMVLNIINFIINRKNQYVTKRKFIKILFLIVIIMEIAIFIVPFTIIKVNMKKFEKSLYSLKNEYNKEFIVITYGRQTKFLDKNGNLISLNNYRLINNNERNSRYDNFIIDTNKAVNVLFVEENDQIWIVDYSGKKIERMYNLFEENEYFVSDFLKYLGEHGYKNYVNTNTNNSILNGLVLNEKTKDTYKFGSFQKDGFQLIVKVNKNEKETDMELYDKIKKSYGEYGEPEEIKEFYQYKKKYYIIKPNGESIELDCNNLILEDDNFGTLGIRQYKNYTIPYYDNDSNGFFDIDGKKTSLKNDFLVEEANEEYATIYDRMNDNYYIYLLKNKKLLNLNTSSIKIYNDKFIITEYNMYIFDDNRLTKVYEENYKYWSYRFINIDPSDEVISPYTYIDMNYYKQQEELNKEDIILNENQ